jgi:hypothetical protein
VVNVSVFPVPGATENTTRWRPLVTTTAGVRSLSVALSGASATFLGQGGAGQLAGVLLDNEPFVYRVQDGDTPALVAAVMAGLVQQVRSCWLSGPTITVPGVSSIVARVVADGSTSTEWARQRQEFRISAWCPDPVSRDLVCGAIGSVFAATSFLALRDGSAGRLRYRATASLDDDQDARQYRRDLVYDVEYGTSLLEAAPAMLFGDLIWAGSPNYA